jgi:hypothetical protein
VGGIQLEGKREAELRKGTEQDDLAPTFAFNHFKTMILHRLATFNFSEDVALILLLRHYGWQLTRKSHFHYDLYSTSFQPDPTTATPELLSLIFR